MVSFDTEVKVHLIKRVAEDECFLVTSGYDNIVSFSHLTLSHRLDESSTSRKTVETVEFKCVLFAVTCAS